MIFEKIFHITNIIFYILLGISILLLIHKIIYHIVGLFPGKKFKNAKKDHNYAILIPARDESAVIEDLLKSIKKQTYNKDLIHTYVIVETEDDPTCEIVKKYENTEIFVRQHLELKGKGYALDEVVQKILNENKGYDAYFIFDADNVLSANYIEEMNKTFDAGYKMALGYRNSKNWNGGWVASCSALTFSMVNTFQNKCRARFNLNVIVSGTGFYIDANVIKKLGGWKFVTLTEDYEISMYTALNNIKSTYNEYAEYYDEQPTKLKVSWNQRLRWVKGFSQTNKKYTKKLLKSSLIDTNNNFSKLEFGLSILPIAFLLGTVIAYLLVNLIYSIVALSLASPIWIKTITAFVATLISVYVFLAIYTSIMLIAEKKHINITIPNAFMCILMSPLFMGLYLPIYFTAIFKKEVKWVKIKHEVKMPEIATDIREIKKEEMSSDEEKIPALKNK